MVEKVAEDYSNYLKETDIGKEVNPLCSSVEEIMARLEEFESLLVTVKIDSNSTIQQNIPDILCQKSDFVKLCQQIDKLEKFVLIVNENLNVIEQAVETAEMDLIVPDYSVKGFLKPFLSKPKIENNFHANLEGGKIKKPRFFNTSEYF